MPKQAEAIHIISIIVFLIIILALVMTYGDQDKISGLVVLRDNAVISIKNMAVGDTELIAACLEKLEANIEFVNNRAGSDILSLKSYNIRIDKESAINFIDKWEDKQAALMDLEQDIEGYIFIATIEKQLGLGEREWLTNIKTYPLICVNKQIMQNSQELLISLEK